MAEDKQTEVEGFNVKRAWPKDCWPFVELSCGLARINPEPKYRDVMLKLEHVAKQCPEGTDPDLKKAVVNMCDMACHIDRLKPAKQLEDDGEGFAWPRLKGKKAARETQFAMRLEIIDEHFTEHDWGRVLSMANLHGGLRKEDPKRLDSPSESPTES